MMDLAEQIRSILELINQNNVDDAFECLATALADRPDDPELHALLGKLVLKTGALEGCLVSPVLTIQDTENRKGNSCSPPLASSPISRQEPRTVSGFPPHEIVIERAELLDLVIQVCERFPRDYDTRHQELLSILKGHRESGESGLAAFSKKWNSLAQDVMTRPFLFGLLFPDICNEDPEAIRALRLLGNQPYLPTGRMSPPHVPSLGPVEELVTNLLVGDPAAGAPFEFLSRYYFFKDLLVACFVDEGLREIQYAVFYQCYLQRQNWRASYASDYPYQGMSRIGISGAKPSEERLHRYGIGSYLKHTDVVLDIGSNNGFLALSMAALVREIHGIEFNPYLVNISQTTSRFLGIHNARFNLGDFVEFTSASKYDVILSLANHCTIDGNLSIDFELYIAKIYSLLCPEGILLFESHNVFGPGAGTPGDDGDLNLKFDIVERYFEIISTTMTRTYVPAFDIDKLFVAMRKRPHYTASAARTFHLSEVITRYANS